jgi:hypothetical protein
LITGLRRLLRQIGRLRLRELRPINPSRAKAVMIQNNSG